MRDIKVENYLVDLWKKGYSIKYITKKYYEYVNKEKKPIFVSGVNYYPKKVKMSDCKNFVYHLFLSLLFEGNDKD